MKLDFSRIEFEALTPIREFNRGEMKVRWRWGVGGANQIGSGMGGMGQVWVRYGYTVWVDNTPWTVYRRLELNSEKAVWIFNNRRRNIFG